MRRILAAVVIALLFHALLFSIKPSWLKNSRTVNRKPPSIAVIMSYKRPVQPPPVKKKPPADIKKINKKKEVKSEKKIKKPASVKAEEKVPEPEPVKEDVVVDEKPDKTENETVHEPDMAEEEVPEVNLPSTGGVAAKVVTDAEPLYRINPRPRYPRMARKRRYEGTVILNVLVNKNGRVDNLMLFESCGYNILDNAALEAVRDWTFEPGKEGDKPVEMWVQVPVRFELR